MDVTQFIELESLTIVYKTFRFTHITIFLY